MSNRSFDGFDQGSTFRGLLLLMYALVPVTAIATSYVTAPYGRHASSAWGPQMPSRLGWIVMESPTLWLSILVFCRGRYAHNPVAQMLLSIYLLHYAQRVLVYPWRAKLGGKKMPVLVAALAFLYNVHNAYLQAYQIGQKYFYPSAWVTTSAFLLGLSCFLFGFCTNIWADSVLFSLRKSDDDKSYKVPSGFLYDLVSCPNYLGEILEWLGWAVLTASWSGFAFFLYTCANLIPRACSNHRWYVSKFEDYPSARKAVLPFLL